MNLKLFPVSLILVACVAQQPPVAQPAPTPPNSSRFSRVFQCENGMVVQTNRHDSLIDLNIIYGQPQTEQIVSLLPQVDEGIFSNVFQVRNSFRDGLVKNQFLGKPVVWQEQGGVAQFSYAPAGVRVRNVRCDWVK